MSKLQRNSLQYVFFEGIKNLNLKPIYIYHIKELIYNAELVLICKTNKADADLKYVHGKQILRKFIRKQLLTFIFFIT